MAAIEEQITEQIDIWTTAIKRKSSAGRGGGKKIEFYGVKKLRGLILDLAVRGLLVSQDSNDEPASELLKQIAAARTELEKTKKIKKQTPSAEIRDDEKPYNLPNKWIWTRLSSLAEIAPRNNAEDKTKVSFVPMPLVSTGHKGEHGQEIRAWIEIKKGYTHFADGDIGVAKITPCFENSKAAVFVGLKSGLGAGTTELHIARPIGKFINPLFVLLHLKSPRFLLIGETKMTGSAGQKRVPKNYFSETPLPLPPLTEQNRIVTKVDELMALCDLLERQSEASITAHHTLVATLLGALTQSTITPASPTTLKDSDQAAVHNNFAQAWQRIAENFDTLFTTEHSIEMLKQCILQLAVMGKLLPQNPNDEPAIELLNRIADEKAELLKAKKIKKQKAFPEIDEEEKPFHLPVGWEWCRLQDAIDVRDGTHASPKDSLDKKNYPLVTSKNFVDGEIDFDSARRISEEDHLEIRKRSRVEVDDILFSMIGGNIGNQVVVKDSREFSVKNVALFKYYSKSATLPSFLKIYTEELAFELQQKASGGAQPFVSLGVLRSLVFAFPPISEQQRIVSKVDELMALCVQLKARLADAQNTQLQLANAVTEQVIS